MRIAGAVLVGGVLALLVWANRSELPAAAHALRTARGGWLCAGFGLLLVWLLNWTMVHLASRRITGAGGYGELIRLFPVSLASIALNLAMKSGNFAGLAAFTAEGRRRGAPTGRVLGAYLAAAQLAEVAFIATLAIGMTVVAAERRLTRPEIIALVIFVIGLVIRVGLLLAAVRSRDTVRAVWTLPARLASKLTGRHFAQSATGADQLFDAVMAIRKHPWASVPAVLFAVGIDLLGAAIFWASLAAVGGGNRPVIALVAYAVSTLFGIVGFLPGGVAFVEVSGAAVLVSFGTPLGVAVAAVVVFRVLVFWIPLVAGLLLSWWLTQRSARPLVPPGEVS